MDLKSFHRLLPVLRLLVLAVVGSGCAPVASKPVVGTTVGRQTPRALEGTNSAALEYQIMPFEKLSAYSIQVDWIINPTNSSLDTLRRDGEIPAAVKALQGRKVAVQGYMKPLKQDAGGVQEFLLMRNHGLCCQTNIPRINEWVHVRMTGPSLPFAHERQFTVRGMLEVGEVLGAGNVVSVYRLTGDKITAAPEAH